MLHFFWGGGLGYKIFCGEFSRALSVVVAKPILVKQERSASPSKLLSTPSLRILSNLGDLTCLSFMEGPDYVHWQFHPPISPFFSGVHIMISAETPVSVASR